MKFIFIIALSILTVTAEAQPMSAGQWKAVTKTKLNGLPLPESEDEECITKEQAKDVKATLTNALKKKGCDLTAWQLVGQKLDAKLSCAQGDLEATGTVHGTVTMKKYELIADAEGTYKGIPSVATITLSGNWIGACTK